MRQGWKGLKTHTKFWLETPKKRDHLKGGKYEDDVKVDFSENMTAFVRFEI